MTTVAEVLGAASGLHESEPGLWSAAGSHASVFSAAAHQGCLQTEALSFWFAHRNRCIVELVRRHPPAGTIVDVGGGNGFVARGLRDVGFDAIVLEPGQAGARNALYRGLSPVIQATLKGAAFRAGSLPAVGLFDVLEHIAEAPAFLREVTTALRGDGKLYLTVPAHRALWSSEDVAAGHVCRYTKRRLTTLLTSAGLEVDFTTYFFTMLPAPIFLLRALPERLGRVRPSGAAAEDHHTSPRARQLVLSALSFEREAVRRGISMPIGASVLVAAHKPR